jgi:PAS domain S-box-containing protein
MVAITSQEFTEQLFALGYAHSGTDQLITETIATIADQWGAARLYLSDNQGRLLNGIGPDSEFEFQTQVLPKSGEVLKHQQKYIIALSPDFFLFSNQKPDPEFSSTWASCFAKQLLVKKVSNTSEESHSSNVSSDELALSSHKVMQLVMDNIPTRVFWKNAQQEYVGANQAFLVDARRDDTQQLKGSKVSQLPWSENSRNKFVQQDESLLSGQQNAIDFEETLEIEGTTQWIQGHKQVIHDEAGNISGILGTYHDITARKKDEEKLRLLATAFESHEGIVIADHNGIILEINAAFCEITGYSSEEIAGKTFQVLHSGRQNQQFYQTMWQSIYDRGRWEGEVWNKRKNGEIYPEWLTITAVKNDLDETTHYVGAFVDLSEIKAQQAEIRRAAAQEQLIGQLFQLTLQASSIRHYLQRALELVLESQPWLMSTASVHLVPKSSDDIWQLQAQLSVSNRYNLTDHPDIQTALLKLQAEKTSQTLLSCQHCQSVPAHSHLIIPLKLDHELIGAMTLSIRAFDSQNTQDEKLLHRLCNVIALGINRRQTEHALIAAKDDAERANVAKSQFLSSMSHELRTPLNAILGFAQLLELEELDETQLENVNEIINAGRHLLELINEVLDLAKIEAGRIDLTLENIQVNDVISECLTLTQPLAHKRQINIEYNSQAADMLSARVDRIRFKQILLNLLSNAVKYNRDGGRIRLQVSEQNDTTLRISVQDNGLGIAESKRKEIFQPFHRLGAESSNIEGTGIGLVISRKLAKNMGGSLDFISEEGQGSNFWLDIPKDNQTAPALIAPLDKASSTGCSRILYIEKDVSELKFLEKITQTRSEIQLIHSVSANEGITIAKNQQPDLVILGLDIPDMDRFDLLSELKQQMAQQQPVLTLLADGSSNDIQESIKAGFTDCIIKPIEGQALLARLNTWLADTHRSETGQNQ